MFEKELDRYEADLRTRVGARASHEARSEMAAHLQADVAARLELGVPPEDAQTQALAALGDLRTVARAERSAFRGDAKALLGAPSLLAVEWFLPQALPITTHGVLVLSALLWIAFSAARGGGRLGVAPRWSAALAGGTLAMIITLLLAMGDNWSETGSFGLPRLGHGSWWEALVAIPMFGLPPLVLFLLICALARQVPGRLELRWVRRG